MSDRPPDPRTDAPEHRTEAKVRRSRISWVWLIPIVAAAIAGYLGFRTVREEGPTITITFRSADGLVAGQTKVRHKAVDLGQVETITLSEDMSQVIVKIRMRRDAEPYLTDQARFWVVRARLSSGSLSGIETLVSGGYIEMDPGGRDGKKQYDFTGLEQPPGVRSGEPGRTFKLNADRVGSLSAGAPVFYRDVVAGEVLGYDLGNGTGPVTITVFVRAPFDGFVREGTHFWNASGLSVQVGGEGIHIEVASLQAVLSGGVAFDASRDPSRAQVAKENAEFRLFRNYAEAQSAGYSNNLTFVTYFQTSVRGLNPNATVEFFGIQIGTVQKVELQLDPQTAQTRVRVTLEIQPERIKSKESLENDDPIEIAKRLVKRGMRAQLRTSSYLTGQLFLALDFAPNAPPAELTKDGDDWVIPSQGGGLDNILAAVSDISAKLDRIPLDEIGQNLNAALRSASGAMGSVQDLANKANTGLTPTLQKLPQITASLQDAVARAGRVFGSIDTSYGYNSQFQRELERAMTQVGDTARSIRLLADFLDRHPEALVRGRANLGNAQ